jgi:endonuclease/exonuclease/phosphatase family metal-dependent hydrolase
MKKRFSSLLTCLLVLVLVNCKSQTNVSAAGDQFRVASYNIRYPAKADDSTGNGWNKRKTPLAELMLSHQFDLIGTQEGYDFQLMDLKTAMPGFDYISYPYGSTSVLHNCATFYRTSLFEVLDKGVFWLSETSDVPSIGWDANDKRICQWTKFRIKETGKVFYFFNVHFYWRLQVAKAESGPLIVNKVKEIAGNTPVICTGDFNSGNETSQIKAVKKLLFDSYDITKTPREGVEGTNLGGGNFRGPSKGRIDFIFLSENFSVEDYKVLSDQYDDNRYPSDYLPVTSLLTLDKH